jgi:hypothetical protein
MSMLLTLLFTFLAFFGLCEFGLTVNVSCFLPQTLALYLWIKSENIIRDDLEFLYFISELSLISMGSSHFLHHREGIVR